MRCDAWRWVSHRLREARGSSGCSGCISVGTETGPPSPFAANARAEVGAADRTRRHGGVGLCQPIAYGANSKTRESRVEITRIDDAEIEEEGPHRKLVGRLADQRL
ncbi:unnamed protein product [Cladocopium goreaui]|uniref:Uncharacterized protein n=1 Tax=Cladocopium goreaui TaxID=2562237 RepID=A0A9P1GLL2_9DINO|nr:unnamed protein product [Cladocopium goreaui]